jgi:iron complex transport system substrate-binding protein
MKYPRVIALLFALLLSTVGAHAESVQRIVSLAPNLTELAFDAGAGERIVATVEYSNHPEAAKQIPRIGNAFRVDMERLLSLHPDAVLVWETGTPPQIIERIRSLKLRVESFRTQRVQDVAEAIRAVGRLAGTSEVAERNAAGFEQAMADLRQQYRGRRAMSVFVQVNEQPLYTVNGQQIISELVELCGGRNVFAQLSELAPAVGIEAVIAANPQVILSADTSVADATAFWRKWRHIDAVRTGNVYRLNADDVAQATTRLAAGASEICRTLDMARKKVTGD